MYALSHCGRVAILAQGMHGMTLGLFFLTVRVEQHGGLLGVRHAELAPYGGRPSFASAIGGGPRCPLFPLGASGAPVAAVSLRGIRPSPVRGSRRWCTVQGGVACHISLAATDCCGRASPPAGFDSTDGPSLAPLGVCECWAVGSTPC